MSNTDGTLQPESFKYTITIVVYNREGMSSQSTSKSFGMKIYIYIYTYTASYVFNKLHIRT